MCGVPSWVCPAVLAAVCTYSVYVHLHKCVRPAIQCTRVSTTAKLRCLPELAICKLAAHLVCCVRALAKHSQHSLSKLSTLTTYSTHKGMHIIPYGVTPTGSSSKRFKIAASTSPQSTRSLIEGVERADEKPDVFIRHRPKVLYKCCKHA